MDAEARAFYAVGVTALILAGLGLLLRALGATLPGYAIAIIVGLAIAGALVIALARRGLLGRWRAWRASRPPAYPAGWKMAPRRAKEEGQRANGEGEGTGRRDKGP